MSEHPDDWTCDECYRPLPTPELEAHGGDGNGCQCAACLARCWKDWGGDCEPPDVGALLDRIAVLEAAADDVCAVCTVQARRIDA